MRFLSRALSGALCLAMCQAPAAAPAGDLRAAVQLLWQANPQVQSARADLEAARSRARAAAAPLYNPSLELGGENADVRRRTIGLSLPLDLSGKRGARSAVGNADVQAAEAVYAKVRRDVAARWLKAWFASALAGREQALGQQRLELMQRFDELAGRRLQVGDISSPERDLAALALGEAQAQQAGLQGQAAAAEAALQALGSAPASVPAAVDQLPPPPGAEAPADALPELSEARARADSADAAVTVARRNRIPDPVVALTGGNVDIAPSGAAPSGRTRFNVVGVSLSIPLPVLNSYGAEVAAARAEADAAAAGLGAQRLAVQARLAEARARYASLRGAGAAFRAGRASAFAERTAMLERLWKSGEIGTSDYLVQLKQSLDTALSGLQLQNDTWQAFIDYQAASGRLVPWLAGNDKESAP